MRKTLSKKFLGKQAIGAIAQNIVHKMFPKQATDMLVYVKHDVVFIKLTNHRDTILLYKQKKDIIQAINTGLEKIGYTVCMRELLFK